MKALLLFQSVKRIQIDKLIKHTIVKFEKIILACYIPPLQSNLKKKLDAHM